MLRQARIAQMEGHVAEELETLRAAVESHPREIAPIYALLEYHRRNGLPGEEHRRMLELFARRLEDPQHDLPIGVLTGIVRDPEADEATLRLITERVERRIESRGRGPEVLELLAQLQERLGRAEAALATLEELYRLQPSDVLRWQLYVCYVRLERWGAAADVVASFLEEEEAEIWRGPYVRLLGKAGRFEELMRQIDGLASDALTSEAGGGPPGPERSELLWSSAWNLRDSGREAEAELLFRRLLEHEPEHQGARTVLLHLYGSDEERQTFAAAEVERWHGETDPRTLFDEGTERLMAGDAEAALDLLKRAAPGLPELEAAWYNLGMAAYRLEDWAATESGFGRAAELNADRAESFFFRGIALVNLGRCGDAVEPLERALELDPDRDLAHYHLAQCYQTLGDAEAAARHRRLYDAARQQGSR